MVNKQLTNDEYNRLFEISKKAIKVNNDDLAYEILHTSLIRYEERTTPERKQEIEKYGNRIGYLVRIICNEVAQYHRNKNNSPIFYYEEVTDGLIDYFANDLELDFNESILEQLKKSNKQGFYLANLFEIYIECNCKILQVANRTGINRLTLKNDIELAKKYLKKRAWQELENQKDWEM